MSQLRKQSVSGRKPTRRSNTASPSKSGTASTLRILTVGLFRQTIRLGSMIAKPCVSAAKRWPKATAVVAVSGFSFVALGYGVTQVMNSVTQSLPETLEVNTPRPDLYDSIVRIASETLQTARSEKWSRTALTDKLLSRISLVDGVDEVSMRAGLDKKLRINVAAQAPLMIIEGKSSEKILIGNKFKIISRTVNPSDYGNLPVLEASELPLNIYTQKEKRRAQNGLFVRPSTVSSANIRWLSQQTLRINSLFTASKLNYDLEKISWRNGSGFAIVLKNKDEPVTHEKTPGQIVAVPETSNPSITSAVPSTPHRVTTVILGENQLPEKFERLSQVLLDLRLKKTAVEQIDLGFSDKAIIRMSENLSEAKRGGIQ